MAQNRKTIESVWATKGNLPDNAIVATADGKYPALDGSLITNVGAGDLLAANNLSELTATASVARTNLELGDADTVEFGALETSQFNFPDLTTSELNAVTDAVAGDTYFDSDRGQFVRFTGAASYDVVTSWVEDIPDTSTISDAITLDESRLFQSGAIGDEGGGSPSVPDNRFEIYPAGINVAPQGYFYFSGTSKWYDFPTVGGDQTGLDVFTPGKMMRIVTLSGNTFFDVRRVIISDVTDHTLVTKPLKAGATYIIEARLNISDMDVGNLRIDSIFTGSYADSSAEITMRNTTSGVSELDVVLPTVAESELLIFGGSGFPLATTSPYFGFYTMRFVITPSSDGVFTLSAKQITSSIEPLFIGKGKYTVTASI